LKKKFTARSKKSKRFTGRSMKAPLFSNLANSPVHGYSLLKENRTITRGETGNTPRQNTIDWHAAFRDGIQLTFYPYRHVLSFEFEHPLNTEPLRIDAVIIKKEQDVVIDNPIGAIFKAVNIVEYKSPGDYLSTGDYHKVGAYARLYSVLNGVETTDMTVTFVGEAYPRKLVKYLEEKYGYEVKEVKAGIHYVEGDIFGVQIIESKRLKEEDGGVWLKNLRGGLNGEGLWAIIEKSRGMPKGSPLSAYMYMVFGANRAGVKEMMGMADAFEEVLEEYGFTAKWEDRGREKDVRKLQKHGMDPRQIAEFLELPSDTVLRYLNPACESKFP
jgi:hypothetical protein